MKARRSDAEVLPEDLRWENRPDTRDEWDAWYPRRREWMLANGYGKLDALRSSEADR